MITIRVVHGNLRIIAAYGEIDYRKLMINEAIWPWFEGQKVKDQDELWPSKFDGRYLRKMT